MDVDMYGEAKFVEKAENAFQKFLEGETPETYINANNIFLQRFLDLMTTNADEIKPSVMKKMQEYLEKNMEIATFNAISKATNDATRDNINMMKNNPMEAIPAGGETQQPPMQAPEEQMPPTNQELNV
jgi:hypothetical protein